MKLIDLLKDIPVVQIVGDSAIEVTGIQSDSRRVEQGHAFVAQNGTVVDGHAFINQCVEKGATAIVLENIDYMPLAAQEGVTYVLVKSSDEALGKMAHTWYAYEKVTIGRSDWYQWQDNDCHSALSSIQSLGTQSGIIVHSGELCG